MRKFQMLEQYDCLRAAVAMVIDLHPSRLRYIRPETPTFWSDWTKLLREKGYAWHIYPGPQCPPTAGPWVASVPTLTNAPSGCHAVAMIGEKLFHDPSNMKPRSRDPRKFLHGFVIERIVLGSAPGDI